MTQARFFYQWSALLKAGFPLAQSLPMAARAESSIFQRRMQEAAQRIDQGASLATALQQAQAPLSAWELSLLELGEASGSLITISRRLGELNEVYQQRSRLYSSLVVCSLIFAVTLLIGLGIGLGQLGQGAYPLLVLVGIGLLALLLGKNYLPLGDRTAALGQRLGQHIPGLSGLTRARSLVILAELSLPLDCGLSVPASLELITPRIPDPALAQSLRRATRLTQRGEALSTCLAKQLPAPALQLISTGEETGTLPAMLTKLGDYYEQELERQLKQVVGVVQPLTLLAIGVIVLLAGLGLVRSLLGNLPSAG